MFYLLYIFLAAFFLLTFNSGAFFVFHLPSIVRGFLSLLSIGSTGTTASSSSTRGRQRRPEGLERGSWRQGWG
ncbi:unnamed protein product [Tuber melanosporum]|uniref:(Perigord truffle) hypothetical protein n=1 Tax=Tuber melanosporum (strain Mel28) TaxID=656061 RepID=D5GLG3_TUBMM|nr:uncharacterized protein GSTUM_00010181001 [Tuber melanosporum]CAZ85356.1 unnamed protein product [Tuber melanosporum]